MAHPQTNFSSNFQGVDPPLEGYWHDDPIPCGSGNVVTDIYPNPAGIPVLVKGFNALTAEDIVDKLDKTGDASNTTTTFTKASDDTSTMASGSKLSAIFTAISSFFASLKALAFKDKVSDSDISGTIADSHIASASTWNGKADKASITGATKCKITYNGQGIVTAGANLDASDIPNLPASKITSGTFGTDRIADDAITAAKVKDNETLPVNISGNAGAALKINNQIGSVAVTSADKTYQLIARFTSNAYSRFSLKLMIGGETGRACSILFITVERNTNSAGLPAIAVSEVGNRSYAGGTQYGLEYTFDSTNNYLYLYGVTYANIPMDPILLDDTSKTPTLMVLYSRTDTITAPTGTTSLVIGVPVSVPLDTQVGSPTTPIYVGPDGQVQPCTQGSTLKTNTATLYISGYYNTTPVYHVKDIKNGCINYVHVKDTLSSSCNLTIEAPALATGEEYDYAVVFDTFTNNNLVGSIDVENCKTTGHFESGVFVHDAMSIPNATPAQVPMIIVTGNVARPQWYDRV